MINPQFRLCLAESVDTGAGVTEVYGFGVPLCTAGSASVFLMHQLSFNSSSVLTA